MASLAVGRGPPLATIIDNDYPMEATDLLEEQSPDVMAVKILKGKTYV